MLRTLNTALVGELIERTSGGGVLVWLCSSTGKSPGSSAGRAGDGGSEYLDKGATDDFKHVFSSTDGKRLSPKAANRLGADLTL